MVDPITLSAAEIAAAIGGRVVSGRADQRIERWSIDTRTLVAGDLFVAVQGDRFDGHDFVAAALAAGAAGAVVTAVTAGPEAGTGTGPLLIRAGPGLICVSVEPVPAASINWRSCSRRTTSYRAP